MLADPRRNAENHSLFSLPNLLPHLSSAGMQWVKPPTTPASGKVGAREAPAPEGQVGAGQVEVCSAHAGSHLTYCLLPTSSGAGSFP